MYKLLIIMILASLPWKAFSLFFMLTYFTYSFFKIKISKVGIAFILYLIGINIISIIYNSSYMFFLNFLLFLVFILPIIFIIIEKPNVNIINTDTIVYKKIIEGFLIVQIVFSIIEILFRIYTTKNIDFDFGFGDIIAGTYRIPFFYKADASNEQFAFLMILILSIYFFYFKNINKFLFISGLLVVFLSSVNHLIISAIISTIFLIKKNKIKPTILLSITSIMVYTLFQPNNMKLILDKLFFVIKYIYNDHLFLASYSLKFSYIFNFLNDIIKHPIEFLITGFGMGSYSSRAALYLSGIYANFPLVNVSQLMQNNTYSLWLEFLERPGTLQGSFNYPFGSTFTLLAELGMVNTILFFSILIYKLYQKGIFKGKESLFYLCFFITTGLFANYIEYFQATFIFYLLWKILPPKNNFRVYK